MLSSASTPFLSHLKYWWRSKSFRFALDCTSSNPDPQTHHHLTWHGYPVFYRPGTSDTIDLHRILLKPKHKREYRFPLDLTPKTILDIGANIGLTSLALTHLYPEAEIFSFEPEPENFTLLEKNSRRHEQIHVFNYGLGNADKDVDFFLTEDLSNRGGFSSYHVGEGPQRRLVLPIREVNQVLSELGIAQVDLIKIDTEGAESEILRSLDPKILSGVSYLTGELHGVEDFELLAYLKRWFQIGVQKSRFTRLSRFEATPTLSRE